MYVYAHTCSKCSVYCSPWHGCSGHALLLRLLLLPISICKARRDYMSQMLYAQHNDICCPELLPQASAKHLYQY